MAGQKILLAPAGLFTNVNLLGKIPPGGLLIADNTVISRPGIIEPRRGRNSVWFSHNLVNSINTFGVPPFRLFNAKLRVGGDAQNGWLGQATPGIVTILSDGTLVWSPDGFTYTSILPSLGQSPLQLSPVEGDRHWYAFEQNGTIYINTINGIIAIGRPLPSTAMVDPLNPTQNEMLDRVNSGYYAAGVAAGLNMTATIDPSGSPTAIRPDTQVAYHFCFGYRDASGIPHLGAPTTRATVVNATAGMANALLGTIIPPRINNNRDFFQVYRSFPSAGAAVDPGDDCGLIYEGQIPLDVQITSIERAANVVTAHTAIPSNYVAGQKISLQSGIVVPITPNTRIIEIDAEQMPSVPIVRNVWCKTGNNGAWGGVVSTIAIVDANNTPLTLPNLTPYGILRSKPVLQFKDKFNVLSYYIEAFSPWIYVINNLGTYLRKIPLNCNPIAAVYDEDTRLVHILGVPFGMAWNADFITTVPKFEIVSTATEADTYFGNTALLNGISGTPYTVQQSVFAGIVKPTNGAQPWIYFAYNDGSVPGVLSGNILVNATLSNGAAWSRTQLAFAFGTPFPYNSNHIPGCNVRKSDGTYTSFFSTVTAPDGALLPWITQVYKWTTDTIPVLLLCTWYYQSGQPGSSISLIADPDNGRTAILINITALGQSRYYFFNDNYDFITAVYNTQSNAGLFLEPPAYYELNNGGNGIVQINDAGAVNQYLSYTATNRFGQKGRSEQIDLTTGTVTLISNLSTVIGSQAMAANNPSESILAGIYTIISAGGLTFTFASVGGIILLTSSNIYAKVTTISFLDAVYPDYIGPYLYTSPSQEGAAAARYPPPLARDIATFRTFGFFANCTQPASFQVTMVNVRGITIGDKLWVGTSYCTAAAAEDAITKAFKLFITADPIADAFNTINSIANVVNINWDTFSNTVLPIGSGAVEKTSFFVTAIGFSQAAFFKHTTSIDVVKNSCFAPYNISVSPQAEQNVIYYSDSNIPDAVPIFQSIRVGQDSKPIRRIKASRDSLLIFKDDGCFILRGYEPPWQVDPYDLTIKLSAIDSLVLLDNAIYGLFTRGAFRISDANVELISLPIQNQLDRYIAGDMRQLGDNFGFGVGDNPDHKFLLWLPSEEAAIEGFSDVVFVYDTFTQVWTKWIEPSFHAMLYQELFLMFAFQEYIDTWAGSTLMGTDAWPCVMMEEKSLTRADLNDGVKFSSAKNGTIYPNDGSIILGTFPDYSKRQMQVTGLAVKAGDYIELAKGDQPNTPENTYVWSAIVLTDANSGQTFTVSANVPSVLSSHAYRYRVYRGLSQNVQMAPTFPTSPAATNHFSEYALSFREAYWGKFTLVITRPIEATDQALPVGEINFDGIEHFGIQDTFHDSDNVISAPPIDEHISLMNFIRTYIPRDQQRGTVIFPGYKVTVANMPCSVDGVYIVMTPGPTSFTRR